MDPSEDKSKSVDNRPETGSDELIPKQAPADALSMTPDELDEEIKKDPSLAAANESTELKEKKLSPAKKLFRKINIYLLLFLIIVAVSIAITVVMYINSQKDPVEPAINSQELTQEALKQLANRDASVGAASQTLTIQGNAVIDGQTLMRGNLNIAGNLQTGGSIQGPTITISGAANLGETQVRSLQVADNIAIQGNTTVRDLSVAGNTTFSGSVTASQITVSELTLSGNARLNIPNHISFSGPSPDRSINPGPLGGGGSASVNGSDTSGTVNINTGNNPQAGCMVRITFNQQFSNQPHVMISPVGVAAGRTQYYVDRDKAGFSICAASPAPGNQAFAFDYFITN